MARVRIHVLCNYSLAAALNVCLFMTTLIFCASGFAAMTAPESPPPAAVSEGQEKMQKPDASPDMGLRFEGQGKDPSLKIQTLPVIPGMAMPKKEEMKEQPRVKALAAAMDSTVQSVIVFKSPADRFAVFQTPSFLEFIKSTPQDTVLFRLVMESRPETLAILQRKGNMAVTEFILQYAKGTTIPQSPQLGGRYKLVMEIAGAEGSFSLPPEAGNGEIIVFQRNINSSAINMMNALQAGGDIVSSQWCSATSKPGNVWTMECAASPLPVALFDVAPLRAEDYYGLPKLRENVFTLLTPLLEGVDRVQFSSYFVPKALRQIAAPFLSLPGHMFLTVGLDSPVAKSVTSAEQKPTLLTTADWVPIMYEWFAMDEAAMVPQQIVPSLLNEGFSPVNGGTMFKDWLVYRKSNANSLGMDSLFSTMFNEQNRAVISDMMREVVATNKTAPSGILMGYIPTASFQMQQPLQWNKDNADEKKNLLPLLPVKNPASGQDSVMSLRFDMTTFWTQIRAIYSQDKLRGMINGAVSSSIGRPIDEARVARILALLEQNPPLIALVSGVDKEGMVWSQSTWENAAEARKFVEALFAVITDGAAEKNKPGVEAQKEKATPPASATPPVPVK